METCSGGWNPFSLNMMAMNGAFAPNPFIGLAGRSGWFDYHLAMSWIDLSYQMTGKGFEWNYNPRTRLLKLHPDPIKFFKLDLQHPDTFGHHIVVECQTLPPEDQNYGETWVKRMALAQAKILLGNIRTTYGNISMLGGVTVDGNNILSQGTAERDKLREELTQKNPPLGVWVG